MRLKSLFICLLGAVFFASACAFCEDGPRQVEDIYKVLLDHNIPIDVEKTRKASVEALLKVVDAGASLLTAEQAKKLLQEKCLNKQEEWQEDLLYIKFNGMHTECAEVVGIIRKWHADGRAGLILDLRDASGDNCTSVDRIAELFVRGDPLMYQVKNGRGEIVESHRVRGDAFLPGKIAPVMILINEGTCEASELLVAVLKNRQGILLVGSSTKGDVGIRENVAVSKNEILHLATKHVVVNGVQYESIGLQPDVSVTVSDLDKEQKKLPGEVTWKPPSEKAKKDRELAKKVMKDPVLLRATDILLGLKATGSYVTEKASNTPSPAGQR